MHSPARRRIPFTAPVWRGVCIHRFSYHYLPPLNVQVLPILWLHCLDHSIMFVLPLDHPDSNSVEKEGAQIMFLDHRPDLAVITALVLSITFILLLSPCSPRLTPCSSSSPWSRCPHFLQGSCYPMGQCTKPCHIPSVRPRAMDICGRIHVPR